MISRHIITILLSAAVILVVSALVAAGFGWLLSQGQDQDAAAVLARIAQGCGLLFLVDLICLVLSLAINELHNSDEPPPDAPAT